MGDGHYRMTSKHFMVGLHPEINLEIIENPEQEGSNAKYYVACGCGWKGPMSKNRITAKWKESITWCRNCKPRKPKKPVVPPEVVRANEIMAQVNAVFKPSVLLKGKPYYWGNQGCN
jgi:hypothetical protein